MEFKFFRYFLRIPLPYCSSNKIPTGNVKTYQRPLFHFIFSDRNFVREIEEFSNISNRNSAQKNKLTSPIVCRETYYYNPNQGHWISCQTALFQFHFMFAIFQLFRSEFCKRSRCQSWNSAQKSSWLRLLCVEKLTIIIQIKVIEFPARRFLSNVAVNNIRSKFI